MAEYKVEYAEIAGKSIPAEKLICPQCHTLDLGTDFDTSTEPWTAICPKGHEWQVSTQAN